MSNLANKIVDGKHTRANVKILMMQLEDLNARGIPIPAELVAGLPQVCERLIQSGSPRVQAMAGKLLLAMLKHNLEVVTQADKMARLDNGETTDRISVPIKIIEGIDPRAFES